MTTPPTALQRRIASRVVAADLAEPARVAAMAALGRRITVRPTLRNTLLQGAPAPLPRALRARIPQQAMAGMSAEIAHGRAGS